MNVLAAIFEIIQAIQLEKYTVSQLEKEKEEAQKFMEENLVPYMERIIKRIKNLEISIPFSATPANGLKRIIEDKFEEFKEGFELSSLGYF